MPTINRREVLKVLGVATGGLALSAFRSTPIDNTIFLPVIAQSFDCPTMTIEAADEVCNSPGCPYPYYAGVLFSRSIGLSEPTFDVHYGDQQVDSVVFSIEWPNNPGIGITFSLGGQPSGLLLHIEATFSNGCVATDECIYPNPYPR